jgi:hypothetical protein
MSPFRLLTTTRCAQVYSMPRSANGIGVQIRFTCALISSLFRAQPPPPVWEGLGVPDFEHTALTPVVVPAAVTVRRSVLMS